MPAFVIFHTGLQDRNGCHLEVYPRSNGEVYICGIGGSQHKTAANLREDGDCEHQVRGAGWTQLREACSGLWQGLSIQSLWMMG